MIAAYDAQKDENPLAGGFPSEATKQHCVDCATNGATAKVISTLRAKLAISGGQRLHVADDGFFVVNLFGQITKFDTLAALQAHADRGAR